MSEQTLDLLIDKLKKEAIEKAEKESADILAEAKSRAETIVADAEEERKSILAEAEKEARDIVDKGKSALQVAGRDLSLIVRNDLLRLLRATLEKEVEQSFDPGLMKKIVSRVVEQIGEENVEFSLPEESATELAEYIQQRFQASASSITVLGHQSGSAGITVTKQDEGWSYDIDPQQVTEALLPLLNAKWAQILTDNSSA